LEFEDDENSKAPFSVLCSSMTGTVWRLSGTDFYKWVLKDRTTLRMLTNNLKELYRKISHNAEHCHDEFKFHLCSSSTSKLKKRTVCSKHDTSGPAVGDSDWHSQKAQRRQQLKETSCNCALDSDSERELSSDEDEEKKQ